MNTLIEKVKQRDKQGFLEELKSLQKNNEIIISLVNIYSAICVTNRFEPIRDFYKALADYQRKKNIEGINSICKLVYTHYQGDKSLWEHVENLDVMGLLYRKERDVQELNAYRDVINENIMGLLDVLWDLLIRGGSKSPHLAVGITQFILEKVSKKDLYKKGVLLSQEKIDGYDLMMNVITHFIECFHFEDAIKKYLKICKELFYYKCRVKDRCWRANLIYNCIFVLSKRTLGSYDDRDGEGCEEDRFLDQIKKKNSLGYLKVITRVNTNLINEVRSQKTNLHAPIYYAKSIDISGVDNVGYLNISERKPAVMVNKN